MTMPTRRQHRAAFTLIELLVVIAIIAILVSLLMAGVQRVRVMGPQVENASRISQISDAIGRCKNDLKLSYIPSQPFSPGGFMLKSSYAGGEPELDILLRAFPNMNTVANPNPQNGDNTNGYTGPNVVLDANQTLCLFLTGGKPTGLTGFSNDPRKPFLQGGATRKGPWLDPNPKLFGPGPNDQLWLIDVYAVPYAYFAVIEGKQAPTSTYQGQSFAPPVAFTAGVNAGTVTPYFTTPGRFMNDLGFQIISAGRDKVFGPGGPLPAVGSPGGEDNQSNFSQYLLGGRLD